jgi:hypothetical protein
MYSYHILRQCDVTSGNYALKQGNRINVNLFFDIAFFKYFFRVLHEASSSWLKLFRVFRLHPVCIGCSFKFILKVGVEESIVNAHGLHSTDQLFTVTLFAFLLWCVHNRLFNGNFEDKFK